MLATSKKQQIRENPGNHYRYDLKASAYLEFFQNQKDI